MPEPSLRRVEELFDRAIDLDPARLAAFLDEQCGGDADLRAAVEELLHFDRQAPAAEALLRSPLAGARPPAAAAPAPVPAAVGRYRVVRLLGEGGMGAVYEAEQDSPRRLVALKVIRPGLVSPALLRRFTHEAQILGRLRHPGIAQIYEAGLAADGRPYFAMEFLRGRPLDEHARLAGLTVPARLDLLARVCDAVQHAHEQGVIHRDLKPANVLVDEAGQPKVLDFGVARATDADLRTTTARTQAGQLLGTLGYMSPEQVTGDPDALDRRSDVYTLGVILFELLADHLPYRLEHLPLPEAARVIREQEPSRLGSIHTTFRGDVETIVATALAKDPARRYASAGELAADLRRHLNNEPIRARPPSALYQLRKFARRNKALVAGAAGVFAALLAGTVVSVLFAWRAAEHASVASYQAYRARLAAAAAALSGHDVADAARHLDAAPAALRGWEWRHLSSRLDDSVAVIPAPPSATRLSPGPQGLRLVTLADQNLRVLDEQGRAEREVPFPHETGTVWAVAQAPEGLLLVDRVGGTTARLRDAAGAVRLHVRVPAESTFCNVGLSPHWKRLAIVGRTPAGFSAGVYDFSGMEQWRSPDLHRADVWSVAFSPDGTRLATASDDHTARLWDTATGRPIGGHMRHPSNPGLLSVTFHPDGARVVTAARDGTVCQWDARTGAATEPPYERHAGEVWTAVYSPDGEWVASAGVDRTVRLWRATGRQDALILHGHTGTVTQLAFAGDGRRLGSVSEDGTARIWDVDPHASLPVLRGHTRDVYPVAYSPDGRRIASGSWDGTVRLWDAATGEPCATLPHPGVVHGLAYGPNGTWLVSASMGDNRLRIWDVATARLRKEIDVPAGKLRDVTVRPDGRRLAASTYVPESSVHYVHVCDVGSGACVFSAAAAAPVYSPDGRWLAVRDSDETTVVLLDAQTHETAARLRGHEGRIASAAFSPDGRRLATCGQDRTVRVWPIDGGPCRELTGHTNEVFAVAFHPDGTRLASAGRDRAVWLWDLAQGEEVARLQGHASFVWSLAFSPDGATLASGSGDATVRLWDTAPLKTRYQARREAAALRPEAERLVEQVWPQTNDPARVVAALRADGALGEPLRHAALRAVLRRTRPPEAVSSNPHTPP